MSPPTAYCLDPENRTKTLSAKNLEGMLEMFRKMTPNAAAATNVFLQFNEYRAGAGMFSHPQALSSANLIPSFQWWDCFAGHVSELRDLAIRILSQPSSSSSSERVWSTASFVVDPLRNKLNPKRAMDLVLVHFNSKLADKIESNQKAGFVEWVVEPTEEDSDNGESVEEEGADVVGEEPEGTAAVAELFKVIEAGEAWEPVVEEEEGEAELYGSGSDDDEESDDLQPRVTRGSLRA